MIVLAIIIVVCILSVGAFIIESHPLWESVSAYQLGFAMGFLSVILGLCAMYA